MVRNDLILTGIQPSLQQCKKHFKKKFALVILRAKRNVLDLMTIHMDRKYV